MANIQNAAFTNTADVNADGELLVALSKILSKAGYGIATGESHDGATGKAALRRSVNASIEKRLSVGTDSILWEDSFSGANINLSRYSGNSVTMTMAQTGGSVQLNAGGSLATTVGAMLRTYRTFPLLGNAPTYVDFWFSLALAPQAQNIIEIGLGLPAAANPYAPTDGVYMQIDTAGALSLVGNFNGTPVSDATGFTLAANTAYHGELVVHPDRVEFYLNGILRGSLDRTTAAPSAGSLSLIRSAYLYARLINNAATAGAQKLSLFGWSVTAGDLSSQRLWATAMGGMGLNAINIPDGVAAGQTANIVNSTVPASATLSNTAAGYTTLGGNWQFAAVAGAETDYALFGYQVPLPANTQPGKNLMIRGVRIESFNTVVAVATTPTVLDWSIGVGSTAVSLATVDSATAGTRAPRKTSLGVQSFLVGAAVGAQGPAVDVNFDAPIICEPGCFVHLILRMPLGTATATEVFRGKALFNAYFE
jgi:hypothetical protein